MCRIILFLVLSVVIPPVGVIGAEDPVISVFFWNVENLFYPRNDSLKNDDDFTPYGERFWGWNRYRDRINKTWKIILSAGDTKPPDLIGLAEIENLQVLKDLFLFSPLKKYGYKIIHQESEDLRGIDVALIYNPKRLSLKNYSFVEVPLKSIGGRPTRDIIQAEFEVEAESFVIFVNHWPSKYGGVGVTEKYRMLSAKTLKEKIDSLQSVKGQKNIVCIGDFNDLFTGNSLQYLIRETGLHRLVPSGSVPGSYKYQGGWQNIDHALVSEVLMNRGGDSRKVYCSLYSIPCLLERDEVYGGMKPYRCWEGYKYREGFSDHLPLIIRFSF